MVARTSDKNVSPSNASLREKKLLAIRGHLQGLLCNDDWSAVDAMLRGVKYADSDLLVLVILWKNKWQQSEPTLLHDVLVLPSSDPPIALLQMLLQTAPQVLLVEDASGNLPLHSAIYSSNQHKSSLEIIKFLIQADSPHQTSLTPITFWQSIRRGDEPVVRFLLNYSECAKALVIPVNGRVPLYYASKNSTETISPLLRLLLEATCDFKRKRWCCLYAAIQYCCVYLHDAPAILELAQREKLYCTNHLVDVADETNKQNTSKRLQEEKLHDNNTKEGDQNIRKQTNKEEDENGKDEQSNKEEDSDAVAEENKQSDKQQQQEHNDAMSTKAQEREATTSSPHGVVEE